MLYINKDFEGFFPSEAGYLIMWRFENVTAADICRAQGLLLSNMCLVVDSLFRCYVQESSGATFISVNIFDFIF